MYVTLTFDMELLLVFVPQRVQPEVESSIRNPRPKQLSKHFSRSLQGSSLFSIRRQTAPAGEKIPGSQESCPKAV